MLWRRLSGLRLWIDTMTDQIIAGFHQSTAKLGIVTGHHSPGDVDTHAAGCTEYGYSQHVSSQASDYRPILSKNARTPSVQD